MERSTVSIGLRNRPSDTEARTKEQEREQKEQEKALQKERHNALSGIITFIKKSPQSNGLPNCLSNSLLAHLCLLACLACLTCSCLSPHEVCLLFVSLSFVYIDFLVYSSLLVPSIRGSCNPAIDGTVNRYFPSPLH